MTWIEGADEGIHNAIQNGLPDGSMVTRFVVMVEHIAPDGKRCVAFNTDPGNRVCDSLGLIEYARLIVHRQVLNGQDEEED